jgi:hypothetical protein
MTDIAVLGKHSVYSCPCPECNRNRVKYKFCADYYQTQKARFDTAQSTWLPTLSLPQESEYIARSKFYQSSNIL